jgi:hypothetical protein
MEERRELVRDLLGGTLRMRECGERWLPQHEAESPQSWRKRVDRSILYAALEDTIEKLAGKPFSRPVSISFAGGRTEMPLRLAGFDGDVDLRGRDMTGFGRELFRDALAYGVSHVFVDYPQATAIDRARQNELELRGELRPRFVHVKADQVVGWSDEIDAFGRHVLTEFRWRYVETEPDPADPWCEREVELIRVVRPDSWQLFRRLLPDARGLRTSADGQGEFALIEEGPFLFPGGGIPLVTLYTKRVGHMTAWPPFEALAWLNLAHWQSSSDQRNMLRVARVPFLFGSGFSQQERDEGLTISAYRAILSTSPQAQLGYIEPAGTALAAGQEDLDHLEARMQILGLQPLIESGSPRTATEVGAGEQRNSTSIQTWIRDTESVLEAAMKMAGQYVGEDLEPHVDIYSDFAASLRGITDVEALIQLRRDREVSRQTFLREVKRRGLLDESTDLEGEIDALGQEAELAGETAGDADGEEESRRHAARVGGF